VLCAEKAGQLTRAIQLHRTAQRQPGGPWKRFCLPSPSHVSACHVQLHGPGRAAHCAQSKQQQGKSHRQAGQFRVDLAQRAAGHGTLGRCCYAFGYELRAGPAGAETAGSGTGRQLQTSRAGDGCGNWWHGNRGHARAAHTWRFCRASQARVGRPTGTHTRGHVRRRAPYDAVLGDEVDCGAGRDGPHLQVQALVPVSAPVDNRCVLRRAPNLWILRVCDLTCHVGCPLRRRTGIEYEPQNDFKPPSATEIADYAK